MAAKGLTTSIYFNTSASSCQLRTSSRRNPESCIEHDESASSSKRPRLHADTTSPPAERLGDDFYSVPCQVLARRLLGKVLARRLDGGAVLKGRIVETECYLGGEDKASHSHGGKVTERNKPMYMKPGTAYVYFTYGMYHCFNISSLEPLEGLEQMRHLRRTKRKKKQDGSAMNDCCAKELKDTEVCNGPAKLCISFDIGKENSNTKDLCRWDGMWIEEDGAGERIELQHVVSCPRIGIDSAGTEWAQKQLRFYILGNKFVSRRNKAAEKQLAELT
ncbi:uncharacterized protein LOC134537669 isoform X2 [Bacillus rossius redtenbacheri]|uniref:uncharacterized protein LOC134537669 isoform X2 n=1 Tax=Bacillus rossius redtenbacheri TaxID=93214 RepID=UPI002FDE7720